MFSHFGHQTWWGDDLASMRRDVERHKRRCTGEAERRHRAFKERCYVELRRLREGKQ